VAALTVEETDGAILYADDLGLRQVSAAKWGVRGTWTQGVLQHLREGTNITDQQYHEAIVQLAAWNYVFVSVNADDLMFSLRRDAEMGADTIRLVGLLHGPGCSVDSAVRIVDRVLQEIYRLQYPRPQRELVVTTLLTALATGRDKHEAFGLLEQVIQSSLLLIPRALEDVMALIAFWRRQR
jgi:hypothetical protein